MDNLAEPGDAQAASVEGIRDGVLLNNATGLDRNVITTRLRTAGALYR